MLSILLVEDHQKFANVLIRFLGRTNNLRVTRHVATAELAMEHLLNQKFDLALVDVFLPVMSGIGLVSLIHKEYPLLPCLMVSGHMLGHYVAQALAVGARGYVLKDDSAGILEAIQQIMKGKIYVSKKLRYNGQ
jgi:DNA-binding NarL/FixJ family response regulator